MALSDWYTIYELEVLFKNEKYFAYGVTAEGTQRAAEAILARRDYRARGTRGRRGYPAAGSAYSNRQVDQLSSLILHETQRPSAPSAVTP